MLVSVITLTVAGIAAPFAANRLGSKAGWILSLVPLGWFIHFALKMETIAEGNAIREAAAWLPGAEISASFLLDGLSLIFTLLILGIGVLILIYSGAYLSHHEHLGRFLSFILLFMASMTGLVLADNLILIFIFWELTSVTSYFLIGFDCQRGEARAAATQALLVTGIGGLALLAGLVMLGLAGGSFELSELAGRGEAIRSSDLFVPMLILILLGCFTKSAQFPFHFWLPNAMQAPTPASAYLHCSTMVKAGVYLLARLSPLMAASPHWQTWVSAVGAATALAGGAMALRQTHLKLLLAYSTVSVLGTLVMLLGKGTETAVKAAVIYLMAHAFYKGCMFLVAGAIDHETGERDITKLSGLRKKMPWLAATAFLAALSMAGAPPLLGFLGKEVLYESALHAPFWAAFFTAAAFISSVFMVAIACAATLRPFLGALAETPKTAHEPPAGLLLGPAVLSLLGLAFGAMPALFGSWFASPGASSILGEPTAVKLALWHGFTPLLGLSVVTLAAGAALYLGMDRLRSATGPLTALNALGPDRMYDRAMSGMIWTAEVQTRILQSGSLRRYIAIILVSTVSITVYAMWGRVGPNLSLNFDGVTVYEAAIAGLALAAALAAIRTSSRLGAIAALGVVGYSVALIYVMHGAPDLAVTQFIVETLTVILFVFVFYHLPQFQNISSRRVHIRDAILAACLGGTMTVLVLLAAYLPGLESISSYFAETSLTEAHGRNVVNVILVDYRALDTMGEITVLAVSAVGAYALLRCPSKEEETS